jgi:prolyl-tRNA synthetase
MPVQNQSRSGRFAIRRPVPYSPAHPRTEAKIEDFDRMRMSQYFLPTMKENPSEAQIVSHRLMLRAGLIRQTSAGIYAWLPVGLRVLKNIERIVREEQDASGAQEVLMPTIQSADLWRESGRYDAYGPEMLRIKDRHDREMLYGPTNEEMITVLFRDGAKSYRDLPKNLYHIQWKFRDEVRPRFGVMRGREFLMKDAYSFDADREGAIRSYNKMFVAYLRTFARLGLKAIPMRADTGPIGGDLSHEFIILAETGESAVFCHKGLIDKDILGRTIDFGGDLQPIVNEWTSLYAATDEMHDKDAFEKIPEGERLAARGIEVGHIFNFGTKYSKPMNAVVAGPGGENITVEMGSYGIGVSRLVGGIIEASHDDAGIVWPESVAPFKVALVNLNPDDAAVSSACAKLDEALGAKGVSVLHDDRDLRAGAKFADMDLIGTPWQVIVGPKGIAAGKVEMKNRKTGAREELPLDQVVARFG